MKKMLIILYLMILMEMHFVLFSYNFQFVELRKSELTE